jgi:hypothetical protein
MSFLGSREKLPLSTVTSAGMCHAQFYLSYAHVFIAHCLYVLTDDNRPISDEVKTNGAYTACLLFVVRGGEESRRPNGKGKDVSDDRETTLRVLCTGMHCEIISFAESI